MILGYWFWVIVFGGCENGNFLLVCFFIVWGLLWGYVIMYIVYICIVEGGGCGGGGGLFFLFLNILFINIYIIVEK